jgi:hypothetical protein
MVCTVQYDWLTTGIGDHQLFVIDFWAQDINGQSPQRIVRSTSCHLHTKIPRVAAEYLWILEEKVIKHCLIERMGKAHTSSKSQGEATRCINKIDKEFGEYMNHAERKC